MRSSHWSTKVFSTLIFSASHYTKYTESQRTTKEKSAVPRRALSGGLLPSRLPASPPHVASAIRVRSTAPPLFSLRAAQQLRDAAA